MSLTGNDNDAAKKRSATISRDDDGGFQLFIQNQFGFTCALEWGSDGSPARLRDCKSKEPGWRASPSQLAVRCRLEKRREVCTAHYRLQADQMDEPASFTFERAVR
jgi:hypothetical protein